MRISWRASFPLFILFALLGLLSLFDLSACVTMPPKVAAELKPAAQDQPNHFRKPQ